MECLQNKLNDFDFWLESQEKSLLTRQKYLRDAKAFCNYLGEEALTKEQVTGYKGACIEKGYGVRSVNSMLASINSFLNFLGREDCRVKSIRIQRQTYCTQDGELTRGEYKKLLAACKEKGALSLVVQTICATGIRVSELSYFTAEAVKCGQVSISCKGKIRMILIPQKLQKMLLAYAKKQNIFQGSIFLGKTGKALDRSVIWRQMKQLCKKAGVSESKVFPHNLRKLFARAFYSLEKDIAKLADILGHSSINTTRIYIMTTGAEHRRQIDRLNLIFTMKNTT